MVNSPHLVRFHPLLSVGKGKAQWIESLGGTLLQMASQPPVVHLGTHRHDIHTLSWSVAPPLRLTSTTSCSHKRIANTNKCLNLKNTNQVPPAVVCNFSSTAQLIFSSYHLHSYGLFSKPLNNFVALLCASFNANICFVWINGSIACAQCSR